MAKQMPTTEHSTYPDCILLTTGNAWGSILEVVRSVGSRGVPVYVVGLGVDLSPVKYSRFCHKLVNLPLEMDPLQLAEKLITWWNTINSKQKAILLPFSDQACTLIAKCRDYLINNFEIGMAKSDLVLGFLDKDRANALAMENGLTVPKFDHAGTREKLIDIADYINFPVIVKPTCWWKKGEKKLKAKIYASKEQLLTGGGAFIDSGATILVQEYIPGGDECIEIYMFYRTKTGDNIFGCTGRKIRQFPLNAGIMASGKAIHLPDLAEISNMFLNKINYSGMGGIEFKRHNGKSYFIELSVRPEGFHPLATKAGVDLSWYWYADIALNRAPRTTRQRNAYYLNGMTYIFLLRDSPRRAFYLFLEVAKLLTHPKTICSVWRINDFKPWLAINADLIKHILKKIL